MSQLHRHTVYFWTSIAVVIALVGLALYKLENVIYTQRSEEQIQRDLDGIKDHSRVSEILKARAILKDIEVTRLTEFKEAQALCMKDVESVKPSKDHTLIYQTSYCRDRAIKYMGYEYEYNSLRQISVSPIPTSIKIVGAT